jgi:hypothetical protein
LERLGPSALRRIVNGPAVLVMVGLALAGCDRSARHDDGDFVRPSASTAPGSVRHAQPADPCAGVSNETAQQHKMRNPERLSYDLFAMDETKPVADQLVPFKDLQCRWSVHNAGRGPNARPNEMTIIASYKVMDASDDAARSVFTEQLAVLREKSGVTIKREQSPSELGGESYYVYLTEESPIGGGSRVEVAVHNANAVITVSFSGADLRSDRNRPAGLQLVTTPVAEDRLRPTVDALLPHVLALLS